VNGQSKPQKRLYSLPEAAVYLGRSEWSVRRLIWAGELPSVRAGRRVHVDLCDMEAFIENNKVREDVA
jgi:excisionase family DNA binding protein